MNEITIVDLYVNGVGAYNTTDGASQDISVITREMVRMIDTRPNMWSLAQHHCKGRHGQLVTSKSDADVTIGIEDCDYSASAPERILSEFL